MQNADSEQEGIVMLLQVRRVEYDRQYQDRMSTASQPWNHHAATEGQRAPQVHPAKEAIVPQIGQMAQRQQSALPLAPPLIFPLRHTQKTHKENAGGDHRVHTGASQIQMAHDT